MINNEIVLAQIFDNHPSPMWICDYSSYRIIKMNKAFRNEWEYIGGDISGLELCSLISSFNNGKFQRILQNISLELSMNETLKVVSKSKVEISCNVNIQMLSENGSRKLLFIVLSKNEGNYPKNLLSKNQNKIAHLYNEAKYKNIVENFGEIIFQTDEEARLTYMNLAWEKITDLDREESKGSKLSDFISNKDREKFEINFANILSGVDSSFTAETLLIIDNDKNIPAVISITAMRNQSGNIGGLAGTIRTNRQINSNENDLEKHSLRNKTQLEGSSDAIYILHKNRYLYVNPAWEKMFGYDAKEVIGTDADFYKIFRLKNEPLNKGEYEWEGVTRSGSVTNINLILSEIIWESKPAIQGVISAKSKTKPAAGDVSSISSGDGSLFMSFSMPAFIYDNPESNLLAINEAACKLFGYDRSELMKMSFNELTSNKKNDPAEAEENLLYQQSPVRKRFVKKDQQIVDSELIVHQLMYANKNARLIVVNDITERLRIEKELKSRDMILQAVSFAVEQFHATYNFEEIMNEVVELFGRVADVDRIYIFENHVNEDSDLRMCQKYEWAAENITPQIDNPILFDMSYHKMGFERWHDLLKDGEPVIGLVKDFPESEQEILLPQQILSVLILPIFCDNEWFGFIGFDECTEERRWSKTEVETLKTVAGTIGAAIQRKKIEDELKLAKNRAEDMNRLKSNFLANMSHELRTPMVGILGYGEILQNELESEEHRIMADNIVESGNRLLETLHIILDLSKIENDKLEIKNNQINFTLLVNERLAYYKKTADRKKLELNFIPSSSEIFVWSDDRILKAILNNLLNNAIKYTLEGGVSVSLQKDETENNIILKISDTGIGIPEEFFELIFSEFRQVSEGISRSFEGIGLGLTLTKKFVTLLGGKIEVESRVDHGSVFKLTLPINNEPKKTVDVLFNSVHQDVGVFRKSGSVLTRPKLLIVEDDYSSREVTKTFLKDFCEIDCAVNGIEALGFVKNNKYDIILMDINLGRGLSGIDVTKQIRAMNYPKIPIIAVTAFAMKGDKEIFIEAGCTHYLSKPFTRNEMRSLISALLTPSLVNASNH